MQLGLSVPVGDDIAPASSRGPSGTRFTLSVNGAPLVLELEPRVSLVEVTDAVVNPLGVKGVGEIGQVGVAAAIANAVFHATGRRVRELPMSPEVVMDPAERV